MYNIINRPKPLYKFPNKFKLHKYLYIYTFQITLNKSTIMALAQETIPLALTVIRGEPELVCPAQSTPRELKPLSDIDDQEGLRFQMPAIMFYRADPSLQEKDPVKVVKDALAKALVFFYPYAGRLVEGPKRKLVLDCTGEGVPFIEAKTDARLEDFGDEIHPPFPLDELLYDIPGTDGMIGTPVLIVQVNYNYLFCSLYLYMHHFENN